MARPENADAEATRRQIIESAHEELIEAKSHSVSIRAVARRAKVSPALIHHYFIDREGLIDAVIEAKYYEELHRLTFELAATLGQSTDYETLVENALRTVYRHVVEHRAYQRLLLAKVVRNGKMDPGRAEQTHGPLLAAITAPLAKRLGRTEKETRLRLRSLILLVSRYAVIDPVELQELVGDDAGDPVDEIEQHLVELTKVILK